MEIRFCCPSRRITPNVAGSYIIVTCVPVCRWVSVRGAVESWRGSSEPRLSVREGVNKTAQLSLFKASLHGEPFQANCAVSKTHVLSAQTAVYIGFAYIHAPASAVSVLLFPKVLSFSSTRGRPSCCRYSESRVHRWQ